MRAKLALALAVGALLGISLAVGARASISVTIECTDPSGPAVTLCEIRRGADVHNGVAGDLIAQWTTAGKRTVTLPGDGRYSLIAAAKTSQGTNTSVFVLDTLPGAACQSGWAPIGVQSWWSDPGRDFRFESQHLHADRFCWPVNTKIVSGRQTFSIPMQAHKLPSGWKITRIRAKLYYSSGSPGTDVWYCTPSMSSSTRIAKGCPGSWPVPDANGSASWTVTPTIDLSGLSKQRLELRWAIYAEGGGKRQFFSTRTFLCNVDCDPSARTPFYQGNAGWYTAPAEYVDVRAHSTIPTSP